MKKSIKAVIFGCLLLIGIVSYAVMIGTPDPDYHTAHDLLVRIAEIEIETGSLEDYKKILKEEAAASVEKETGVVAIFPMYQKDSLNKMRILEIYRNKEAYEQHVKTPHFLHYKSATATMVKSLRLMDMEPTDIESMHLMFGKMAK